MTPAAPPVLWSPDAGQARATQIAQFAHRHAGVDDLSGDGYQRLHAWSVAQPEAFWRAVWQDFGVIGEGSLDRVLLDGERMPGARWFPDVRLNFAENLLQRGDGLAVIAWDERRSSRTLGFAELRAQAAALAAGLRDAGIGPGDRVAGYLHNGAEALAGMTIGSEADMEEAGRRILALGPRHVLVKGGHLDREGAVVDILVGSGGSERFAGARIATSSTHGTGCTLASAIATGIAQGMEVAAAAARARDYVVAALRTAPGYGKGHGPLNHAVTVSPFPS